MKTAPFAFDRGALLLAGVLSLLVGGSLWAEGHLAPGLMPHGVCYTWLPALLWLHVSSDLLIGVAYLSIPITLGVLVRRRRDLPFNWVFVLFSLFIIACGLTHFMEVLTVWQPMYWLSGAIKALTAAASVPTAIVLVWLLPRMLVLPTVEQLRRTQASLEEEVERRRRSEAGLRDAQAVLEQRVADRTRELAEATALLDTVFERAPVGIGLWDGDARFLRANGALAEMDGVARAGHVGRPTDALLPGLSPSLGEAIRGVAATGRPVGGLMLHGRTPASIEPRHLKASLYPVDVDGTRVAVGGIVEEVTEQRRAEHERARLLADAQSARAEAEEANRSKDRFLATVSHELRTPLQAILSWVHVLRHPGAGAQDTAGALVRIDRNVRAQARLIDDLLDYARIGTGKLSLEPEPGDPTLSIERAVDVLRPLATEAGVTLEVSLHLAGARCLIDADRFQQVVSNLLANAIKFTPRGGRIDVEARWDERGLHLSVSDTGAGIERAALQRIFEPFQQGRPRAGQGAGLGLGLSISRAIVHGLGGRIGADSDGPGRGTCFTVWLPPHDGGSSAPAVEASRYRSGPVVPDVTGAAPAEPSLRGLHVLLVEDDPDSAEAMARGLRRLGARVSEAASVEQALEMALRAPPDALVSDLKLGDGSGLVLPDELLRRLGRRLPSVAVSAYGRRDDREASLAAGFDVHRVKPVDPVAVALTLLAVGAAPGSGAQGMPDPRTPPPPG